jgi:hypothetical protein
MRGEAPARDAAFDRRLRRQPGANPFLVFGIAGAAPFIALAVGAWSVSPADRIAWVNWLIAYAALILAFVGALHWGVAMTAPARAAEEEWVAAGWSVLPALFAWVAMAWPPSAALLALAALFVAQWAMDVRLARRYPVPRWFLPLRAGLTAVVAGSLACTAAVASA